MKLSVFLKKKLFNKFNKRYLIIGIVNTILGYLSGILSFFLFYNLYGIFFVGLISNFVSITITFLNYKFFLFKTKKNFFVEYAKSFINYGFISIISIILLWFLVDVSYVNIYLSQLIIIPVIFVISYFGNRYFVFNK